MADTQVHQAAGSKTKNQVWFKVENATGYNLVAQSSFADWGDVAEPPSSVSPSSTGSGGHIISSHSPLVGSARFVGYKIVGNTTLYLRILASNPYLSVRDNYATAAVITEDKGIDQTNYNWLYKEPANHQHNSKPFEGKTLKITSQVGQADDVTAIFRVTLE